MTPFTATTAAATPAQRSNGLAGRRARGTAAAAALLLALTGCSLLGGGTGPTPSPTPETVKLLGEGTTEVELKTGEKVQVSLGSGSPGVGDDWGVVSQTDEHVAAAEVESGSKVAGQPTPDTSSPQPVGGSVPFAVQLTGKEPGTTTVRVLYCTRSSIAEGCDQSLGTLDAPVDPVEITVTVH